MCHHRGFSRRHTPDRLVPAAREAVLASDGAPVKHPHLYGLLVSIQQKQSKQHTYPTALCVTHIGGHRKEAVLNCLLKKAVTGTAFAERYYTGERL